MPEFAFEEVREWVRIARRAPPTRTKIFSEWTLHEGAPAYARLFHLIVQDQTGNEDGIAKALGYESARDDAYQMLRTDLTKRLQNTLFLLDPKRACHSASSQARQKSDVDRFTVERTLQYGSRKLGTRLARKALKFAVEFEFWLNAMEFAMSLREDATLQGDIPKHKKYSEQYRLYLDLFEATQRARMAMESVEVHFARSSAEKPWLAVSLRERLVEVEVDRDRFKTFGLALAALQIRGAVAQIEMHSRDALRVCVDAEALIAANPKFANRFLSYRWVVKRLKCAFHLRDYSEAASAIASCESLEMTGENNWFVYQEYAFLIAMHTEDFERASTLAREVTQHPRFDVQSDSVRERWEIYSPFGKLLSGDSIAYNGPKDVRQWVPHLSPDKAGFNVSLLILQLLVWIKDGDEKAIFEKIDKLRTYIARNLVPIGSEQTTLFLKLLLLLDRYLLAEKEALNEVALVLAEIESLPNADVESVQAMPYPWVWEQIVGARRKHDAVLSPAIG